MTPHGRTRAAVLACAALYLWFISAAAQNILNAQLTALEEVKKALDPITVVLTSWNRTLPECTKWLGVTCNKDGAVTSIVLANGSVSAFSSLTKWPSLNSSKSLQGNLTDSICNLTSLETLSLRGNQLSGQIPSCIGNLKNLQVLDLSQNNITGIPSALGLLSNLQYLDLSCVSGPYVDLVEEIGQLKNLSYLNMSNNAIDSSIPASFGNLTSLQTLDLSFNYITGAIPPALGLLANLTYLNLGVNQLNGTLPASFGALRQLQHLDLNSNSVSGTIPDFLGSLSNLTYLNLNHNNFSGTFPSLVASLNKLKILDVSINNLTGELPDTWGSLNSLQYLDCSMNQFTGSIPESLGSFKNILELFLNNNSFSGDVPAALGQLSTLNKLDLSDNSLQGLIPKTFGNLSSLQMLQMSRNSLTGFLPSSLRSLGSACPGGCMKRLRIQSNILRGPLLVELMELSNLVTLDLRSNELTGAIPPTIGNLKNLKMLDLSDNGFTGQIPAGLTHLPNLEVLAMSGCSLSGPVPSFENLTNLFSLDLSLNQLRGQLPQKLVSSNIISLNLANNILTGPITLPNNMSFLQEIYLDNNTLTGGVPNINASMVSLAFNRLTSINDTKFYTDLNLRLYGNLVICPISPYNPEPYCDPIGSEMSVPQLSCPYRECEANTSLSPYNRMPNGTCYCEEYSNITLLLVHPPFKSVLPELAQELGAKLKILIADLFPTATTKSMSVWISSAWPHLANSIALTLKVFRDNDVWDQQKLLRLRTFLAKQKLDLGLHIGAVIVDAIILPPALPLYTSGDLSSSHTTKTVIPTWALICIALGGGLVLLLSVWVAYLYFHRPLVVGEAMSMSMRSSFQSRSTTLARRVQQKSTHAISLKEVMAATDGFAESNLLGEGSYGQVYKGRGPGDQLWAVKRTKSRSLKNLETFQQEVDIISQVSHYHIVKLLGFCEEDEEQILIYEFAEGGTLYSRLHPRGSMAPLTYPERLAIATGVAEALHYLHTYATPTIIHRDVKSDNILLDHFCQAKLADFGFLKNTVMGGTDALQTRAMGTPGYMDPEYYWSYRVTPKSDVYSFGVVLLELITGRTPLLKVRDSEDRDTSIPMVHWAIPQVEAGNDLDLVDLRLEGDYDVDGMKKLIEIAAQCVQRSSAKRPNMRTVARQLSEVPGHPGTPRIRTSITEVKSKPPLDEGPQPSGQLISLSLSDYDPAPMSSIMTGR